MSDLNRSAEAMIKRIAKIIGLALLGVLLAAASVGSVWNGKAHTGRFGGFREISEAKESLLFFAYTIGYLAASCFFFFVLWKEIRAFRAWLPHRHQKHRFAEVIDK